MRSHDEILAWFEQDDARSRPYRAERLRFLLRRLESETMTELYGGEMAFLAFEEARRAFVHGLFVACTVLSQVCVEHTLGGLFRAAGRDDLARATFEVLLREGRNEGYLSEDEFSLFDRLRTIRNPYVHSRAPLSGNSLHLRAMQMDLEPDELVVKDAELAIGTLLRFLGRFTIPLSD